MSQFWIYLKTEVKAVLKEAPQVIGLFLLLPFFFAVLMGFSFNTAFVPEVSFDPILLHIQNEDQGTTGDLLLEGLETVEMKEYFEQVDTVEADFIVTLLPNYSENLADTLVNIEAKPNTSSSERQILTSFLTDWQQSLVNQQSLMTELSESENPEATATLQTSLAEIATTAADDIFEEQVYASDTALTSNQYSSVSGLMYILILTLSSSVNMTTHKDFKGLKKRLDIVPLSPLKSVLYQITTNTIIYSFIIMIYMLIWKVYDAATFMGNPLFYIGWIILYTLFFQALNAALRYIIPGKLSGVFYQVFLMVYMVLAFLPLDKIIGGDLAAAFNQNFIRQIFNQPMYDFILNQQWFENMTIALGLLLGTLVVTSLTITIRNRRELLPA